MRSRPRWSASEETRVVEDDRGGERPRKLEKKVRKVLHLDPFRISRRQDGRFYCELEKPPEELSPEEASELLAALEPILERLRERSQSSN